MPDQKNKALSGFKKRDAQADLPSTLSANPAGFRHGTPAFHKGAMLATLALVNAMLGGTESKAQDAAEFASGTNSNSTGDMPEVVVKGKQNKMGGSYNQGEVSLSKYPAPLLDTPQSVTVVPQQVMTDQGSSSMLDVLRNVSGVSLAAGEGGSQGDNLTIRGFTARSDFFLDGMRDFGNYYRDPFNTQSVEVLKGPASVAFGRGSTGGVVNQVSKMPEMQPFTAGTFSYSTSRTLRGSLDFNQPVSQLGDGSAFRLNLMGDDGNVAGRDGAAYRRFGIAPSLSIGLGTPTRFYIGYYHQTEDNVPDYGIPWLLSRPAPVNRQNYYGFKDGNNFLKTDVDILSARVEHDFSDNFTLRDQFRYANYDRNVRITEAQVPATVTSNTPLQSIQVNRNQINAKSTETSLDNDLSFVTKFDTWGASHTLITGFEMIHETSDPRRNTFTGVPTTSLLFPNDNQPFRGTSVPASNVNATVDTLAGYLLDTVKLGEKWELTGGIRFDYAQSDYSQSVAPVSSFSRTDEMPSWRAAVVYKPRPNGSFYFGAGTSFNPSAEQLSLSAATANVAPEKNLTFELGTKWDLFEGRLSLSGALFHDEKTSARTPDPNNPLLNVLGGDQLAQGIDLGAAGRITDKWQVFGGYTFTDSKVVSSTTAAQVGNPLVNAPKNTFSLWTTYELPWNLEVGFGANAVSSRNASLTADTNTGIIKQVPGYVIFNAMVKYHVNKNIDVQLNLDNLTDKYYYDGIHPAHIIPGAGRTLMISTSFKF